MRLGSEGSGASARGAGGMSPAARAHHVGRRREGAAFGNASSSASTKTQPNSGVSQPCGDPDGQPVWTALPRSAEQRRSGPVPRLLRTALVLRGPHRPRLARLEQLQAPSGGRYGAEGHLWPTEHVGLAVQLGFSSSDVRQEQISGVTSLPASVWWLGGSAAFKLTPADLANDVRLRVGAGYVQHNGLAFRPYSSPSSVTALAGIGATWPLGPSFRVAVGLDSYFYSLQLTDTLGTRYRSRFQSDMVARIGVLWSPPVKEAVPNPRMELAGTAK